MYVGVLKNTNSCIPSLIYFDFQSHNELFLFSDVGMEQNFNLMEETLELTTLEVDGLLCSSVLVSLSIKLLASPNVLGFRNETGSTNNYSTTVKTKVGSQCNLNH